MGESIKTSVTDPSQYSPLALAYLGDAVYELIVRERVLAEGNRQVNKLHKESTKYVNAAAQAELIMRIEDKRYNKHKPESAHKTENLFALKVFFSGTDCQYSDNRNGNKQQNKPYVIITQSVFF